jgi:hypothetical protein
MAMGAYMSADLALGFVIGFLTGVGFMTVAIMVRLRL